MGGYSQVLYQIELLRSCIDSGIQFQRVFILTGQDFPLMSKTDMDKELHRNSHKEYIVGLNLSKLEQYDTKERRMSHLGWHDIIRLSLPRCQKERLTLYHYRDIHVKFLKDKTRRGISRILLLIARLIPIRKKPYLKIGDKKRWDVYLSSSYMCITMSLARCVYDTMTMHPEIEHYFKHSFVPEEMVIPTIVFNSSFSERATIYPYQRYDGLISLSEVTYFDYGKGIKVFDESNLDELLQSKRMFARKFNSTKSVTLMSRLMEFWNK